MAVEERVQIAIDNWAPRFLANGVEYSDYQRLVKRIERWDDWSREWSACAAEHERLAEEAEAKGDFVSAAALYFQATITYHFGKFVFVQNPTVLRAAHEHVVRCYNKGLPFFEFPGERVTIPYEQGSVMYGVLRKPWHIAKPPLVILLPGLDSVKEELHRYGNDFLRRGMAVLALDGPGQGEMEFQSALRHDYEVPVRYAMDYLASRVDVDASRVGLMGVSLGGYFAPRAAAFESRVKAVIANCGFYSIAPYFERLPLLTQEAFLHRTRSQDMAETQKKLEAFDLQGLMKNVRCPLLVIMGRLDRLVPVEAAQKMVAETGGERALWLFDDGNHVCNNIVYKHRPQQADWMRRLLYA